MARNEIKVIITGDTKQFESALGRASKTSQSNFQKIGKAAGVAGLALGAGLAVAAKIGFDELAQGQKVAAQTTAVIKSTGQAANVTAKEVSDLAEALMMKSGVDDEVIASGENMLLTFKSIRNEVGKGNDIFNQATKATLDLSVAMGKDMQSSAILVGKALNDPIRGLASLRRVGVQFTKAQENQIKALVESGQVMKAQKVILKELESQFGGSAEAAGKTLPGQLAIAKESFTNLAGELVANLLPALTKGTGLLLRFSAFLQENPKLAKGMVIGLGALTAALLTASAAQVVLNLAVLANPYVAAVAGIIALGAAITVLVTKVDFFRRHWQLLLIVVGAGPVLIATVVKAIIRHFGTLEAGFKKIKAVAQPVFAAVASYIRGMLGPLFLVIGAVKDLIGWIKAIPNIGSSVPGGRKPVAPGSRPSGSNPNLQGFESFGSGNGFRSVRAAGAGGGEVRVVVVGGDQQAISYFQRIFQDDARRNGGRRRI
jgi:hypothetical protein